jgi:hypothetical protein
MLGRLTCSAVAGTDRLTADAATLAAVDNFFSHRSFQLSVAAADSLATNT